MVLVSLLGIFVAAVAIIVVAWWTERALRRPGLAFVILGVLMVVGALPSLLDGNRVLPILFVVQGISFLYFAHWRSAQARSKSPSAHGQHIWLRTPLLSIVRVAPILVFSAAPSRMGDR